jgi:hypothetical protein
MCFQKLDVILRVLFALAHCLFLPLDVLQRERAGLR